MMDIKSVPDKPGCYIFKSGKSIQYIGKAKRLKKRVKSYFNKSMADPKTASLVEHVDDIDFVVTKNEVEALILENTLVKRHQPRYNIDLKDSKQYAYIQLTDEEFPRLALARRKEGGGKFFGPFTSAAERSHLLKLLNKTFKLRTCKRLPKKACLRYHIGICKAPCIGNISKETYENDVSSAKLVMTGKTKELVKSLKADMKRFSKNEMFEEALEARDRISALEYLTEKQAMDRGKSHDEDVINFISRDSKVYLILFNVYRGVLSQKNEYSFDETDGFFEEFVSRYYSENPVPKEIISPVPLSAPMIEFLERKRSTRVKNTVPKIGEKRDLLDITRSNIELGFFGGEIKAEALGKALGLNDTPEVIECFDISHLSGTSTAGSMVQFVSGQPNKSNYRRFKIRTAEKSDDYAAIGEVVKRRYKRLKADNGKLPDLIIIDGGKGQLRAAYEELSNLGLSIPVMSIAKKLEEIYLPGLPFPKSIDKRGKALQYVREIRDEAHRFAVKYNRLLRKKEALS